jgi:HEAT repeat protein
MIAMSNFSNIPEIENCLNNLLVAKSGNNSQAIADVEYATGKLYRLARTHWRELLRIVYEGRFGEPDIRPDIIVSLKDIDEPELIILFEDTLLGKKCFDYRFAAISALLSVRKRDLVDIFVKALNDPDNTIISCAIDYLQEYGDIRALSKLESIVRDQSIQRKYPGIIESAYSAISKIKKV